MPQEMGNWISFYKFLMSIRWLGEPFKHTIYLLAGSEFVKTYLTALQLQGTISAMKGGGVQWTNVIAAQAAW